MAHQVEIVPALITGVYRFTLAAAVTFLWALLGKYPLRFPLQVHLRLAMVGVFMFSSNFVMFYFAAGYIASGLMAVIFSLVSLFNIILSALFLGMRPTKLGMVGTVLGLSGIGLIFWPEISVNAGDQGVLYGLGFGLGGDAALLHRQHSVCLEQEIRHTAHQCQLLVPDLWFSMASLSGVGA